MRSADLQTVFKGRKIDFENPADTCYFMVPFGIHFFIIIIIE